VAVASRIMADAIARMYGEYLPRHARGRLIDLGCGKAPLYVVYRDLVDAVTCVDWAGSLHRNEHLDCECDLSRPLPFGDAQFDTIVLSDVLEHIADPQALCREMARILAPGGRLLMNTPFYYWLHEVPHDYYRYTEFALRDLLARSGLEVLHLEPLGGIREVLADLTARCLERVPGAGPPLADLVQIAASAVGRRPAGAAGPPKTELFPLGYFLVAGRVATA